MIIYRQKQYSTRLTRAFYNIEKIKNKLGSKSGNSLFNKISDKMISTKDKIMDGIVPPLNPTEPYTRKISIKSKKISPARNAIIDKNNVKKNLQNARISTEYAITNPGSAASEGIESMIRYPIAGPSQIAGKAAVAIDPLGLGVHPLGAYGIVLEKMARKGYPNYAKLTDNWGDKFRYNIGKKIEGGVNGVIKSIKNLG